MQLTITATVTIVDGDPDGPDYEPPDTEAIRQNLDGAEFPVDIDGIRHMVYITDVQE